MITDNQKELLIQQYYDRGVLKKEIRSYEVSLWTLQDEFITVLKWSDVEQKGRIESPKMTLNIDGTEKFTFSIPMYYRENGKLVENPNWYNVQNDKNLMVGMRKLKVIFNKDNPEIDNVDWRNLFDKIYVPADYNGNVNLFNRPIVPASKFIEAGWDEFGGTYGTLYSKSFSYTIEGKEYDIIYTPVSMNGSVTAPAALATYISSVISSGPTVQDKLDYDASHSKLLLGIYEVNSDNHNQWAEELHEMQAEWDIIRAKNGWFGYNSNPYNIEFGESNYYYYYQKYLRSINTFEFIITNVTETHERDILTCEIESEGLAFQELGKIGYKISLSLANFELVYKEWETDGEWTRYDGTKVTTQPIQNVQYWCEEAGLEPVPSDPALINSRVWYYDIQMNWDAFADGKQRDPHVVYEEAYTSSWDSNLRPLAFENFREKARSIEVENSNLYNITKTIAEKFEIFCRYEYMYDENYHIIGRKVVFYNNFMQDGLGSITLQYPYSSSKISRTMDSTAITTKLFVLDVDEHGIADAEPNASREDYILNFDFLYQTGAITQEQYDAIQPYYKDVRAKNDELINLQNQLIIYQEQQPEIAAKKTILENSKGINKEQIEANSRLGTELGVIELTAANPDYLLIHTGENGSRYVNLSTTNKGIMDDSITVWATFGYDKDNKPQLSNQITGFTLDHDGANNLTTLTFTQDTSAYTSVYLLYKYDPKLYYDNVIEIWKTKAAQDELDLQKQITLLDDINEKIDSTTSEIERVLREKEQIVKAFERLMGPALREGYWQPEDYDDYGDRKISNISLSASVDLTQPTGKEMKAGWDSELFTGEQKLYYQEGVNEDKIYYPCINLKTLFNSNIPTDLSDYSIVWKATNKENYSYDWASIKDLKVLSIGSSALIRFIKFGSEGIIPILVVTGAQAFIPEELTRLTETGEARLEKYSVSIDETSGITSVSHGDNQIPIGNNWIIINKNTDETTCPIVQPRIKNSAMTLKTDTNSLFIKYGNNVLSQFSDYYINTRIGEDSGGPEYYITIKPEVLIKYGLSQNFNINYILSNANTAIYLDARKVSQENAYPKVSYSIDVNLLNTSLLHTLYSKLARIVMVNDTDLKFENTFGYISQVDLDLDNCQNDTVEIKNYKTKFEDLFSTIVAQTEEMKRSGAGLTTALSGGIPLSEDGFTQTIAQHKDILDAYLDSHFDSSQVVRDRLTELFGEAGDILGGANKTLNKLKSLTIDNAGILSKFAENVAIELTTKIYRSTEKPASFKPGDIWIYTDEYGNEYRYLAMADSSSSGSGSDFGFVRTHDGSLASIRGANVVWDAEAGTVDITGENEINIRSGKNLYLAANADVNIVGNKSVNIGGSTINIGAGIGAAHFTVSGTIDTVKFKNKTNNEIGSFWFRYKDGWTYKNNQVDLADYGITISVKANQSLVNDVDQLFVWNRGNDDITWMESNNNTMGSINLVASGITQIEEGKANTELAKVLINPYKIEMGAAELEMKAKSKIILRSSTGTYAKTAAISISAEEGVYIGAGQGVRIYSGSPPAKVYVGPAHYSKYQKGDIWVKITDQTGHIGYDGDADGTNFYTTSILSGAEHNTFEVDGIYDALDNWNANSNTPEPETDYRQTTTGWKKRSTSNVEKSAREVIAGTGASVELNKEHLLLGFANIEKDRGSAIELTDEFVIIASGKNISGNLTTDKNINVNGLSTGLIGAKFTNSSIGFATQSESIVNAFIMNDNGLIMGTQNTRSAIDLVNSSKDQLRSHFSSTNNGSYVRIAPEGIELGSLGDLYINTDNFKLQTHSRSAEDYPNGEYIDGNTILALGAGFNQNNITGRESIADLRTLAERETNPIDIRLVVNQNGAYFKGNVYADNGIFNGTVYAGAGSFTGDITASSFILNDDNAYSITTTYALSTSTSQPENSSFTYTSKPTTSQISAYANDLTASQKEQIYLWSKITTSLGGKSTSIYSCEHVNEDGTIDIIKIDYAVNSTASVPSNVTWYTDIATAKNQISQSNQFLITRTKIFQNYAWSTSYDFAKLLDDPESPQVYVESIKMLYYLSTGSAPSQITGTTEVTSTVDSTDAWTLVVPNYTGTSTSLYTYYTCEQKKWVNHTPTLEWTAPVQNYGLTIANQHATDASKAAADAATAAEPITAYGIIGKNSTIYTPQNSGARGTNDPEYPGNNSGLSWANMKGYPMWNGVTYGLILGNNQPLPMLIGGNNGVTIVDTNNAAGGSSIVLKSGGIGMHGSTINFTTADATTTNAISINSSGITMGTTGNITLLSNNIILNSTATDTNSLFELKKKASDWTEQNNKYDTAMKYSITNGLEITGKITATSFTLGSTSIPSDLMGSDGKINSSYYNSGGSTYNYTYSTDGMGWFEWPENSGNWYVSLTSKNHDDTSNVQGVLIGYSETSGVTQHLIVPYSASSPKKMVDISRNGIYFDTNTEEGWTGDQAGSAYAGSWELSDGRYKYKLSSDNSYYTGGWLYNSNHWYYIGTDGYMYTGIHTINNSKYYFNTSGAYESNHIYLDNDGIDVIGNRISVNGNEVWARDDIIVMKRPGATGYKSQEDIESQMNEAHDWVLIKPYYDAEIVYTYKNYGADVVSERGTNVTYAFTSSANVLQLEAQNSSSSQTSFGSNSSYYLYTISFKVTTTDNNAATGGCNVEASLSNGTDTVILTSSNSDTYIAIDGTIPAKNSGRKTVEGTSGQLTGTNAVNLCTEGAVLSLTIHAINTNLRITDITVTCTCDATTSRVPCTVYYYP